MENKSLPLLYGYDSDNNTFTPLPASPLLLPAILLGGIVALLKWAINRQNRPIKVRNHPSGCSRETFVWYRDKYNELLDKKYNRGGLTPIEETVLLHVAHPPWNDGKLTTY